MPEKWNSLNLDMNQFILPFDIDKDSEYQNKLTCIFNDYIEFIDTHKERRVRNCIKEVEKSCELIKNAISAYYAARPSKAYSYIKQIIEKYKGNKFIVSSLFESYAFKGSAFNIPSLYNTEENIERYKSMQKFEVILYRGRVSKDTLFIRDMLHIPLDCRGVISNQRFSINGIPCLYLGNTTYAVWKELEQPNDNELFVSAFKLQKDLKVLNLCLHQHLFNGKSSIANDNEIEQVLQCLSLFPLVIATSCNVKEKNRTFKSEYIISQLVMEVCLELGIQSVAYISKTDKDDLMYPIAVNLAVIIEDDGLGMRYWHEIDQIFCTKPIRFSEFRLQSRNIEFRGEYKSTFNALYGGSFYNKISLDGSEYQYISTEFSRLDEYLAENDRVKMEQVKNEQRIIN